ncbi:nuclear speckle splicing regulatory protein 1 [Copidosoma floridanum]|uniref:nuclear speckle splicing regulatory protein 1 n=1 Tax=Copidosoma floridanum TaxID=29053 RepID=UPI0006C9D3C3|nr:nuclear speckle splicing regulatory protein 1 [Copidosoma floridanum]
MANNQPQQYGLILTNKKQLSAPKIGNIFGNNDDSEEDEGTDWVKKALKAEHEKNKSKKQTQISLQKALKEDPTVFQYDEVYDEMERTKEEEINASKKVERKSKYIDNLLRSAELRKKEQELRKDRMIQKEIEAEDAMFPDKERFVTSSYKAKLEEMKQFEEEQANKDRLEAITDVTKQKDISGFYRHLYRQTVEKNKADLGIVPEVKKTSDKNENRQELHLDLDKDDSIPSDSESKESDESKDEEKKKITKKSALAKAKLNRQYRKRAQEQSASESESEPECENEATEGSTKEKEKPEEKPKSEIVAPAKKQKLSDGSEENKAQEAKKSPVVDKTEKQSKKTSEEKVKNNISKDVEDKEKKKSKPEVQRKVNIWVKRTVGPTFEAALQRYLTRKQQRLAGS